MTLRTTSASPTPPLTGAAPPVFQVSQPHRPDLGPRKPLSSGPCRPWPRAGCERTMTSALPDGHGTVAEAIALTPDTAEQLGGLYARIVESVQSVLYADDDMVQLAV